MSQTATNQFQWPIVGHSTVVSYLQQNIAADQLAHAYLFVGPVHVGKQAVAEQFVQSILCSNLKNKPCADCQHCRQIAHGIHPDVAWVRRETHEKTGKLKKNISIEQVRALQDKLHLRSFLNSYKVGIIDGAETLSVGAANSLLKTLEEPSDKTILILLSANLHQLPQTVISRCRVIRFFSVQSKVIVDHLLAQKVERKKATHIAAVSFGLPGLALHYAIHSEAYDSLKGSVRTFIDVLQGGLVQRFKLVNELLTGLEPDAVTEMLATWRKVLRDVVLIKCQVPQLIHHTMVRTELEVVARQYGLGQLLPMIAELNQAQRFISSNVNYKLTVENLVLSF